MVVTVYQKEVAYCYHAVNVITLFRSQSGHSKRLPMYVKISHSFFWKVSGLQNIRKFKEMYHFVPIRSVQGPMLKKIS
jgi:hypothetical protein